MFKFFKSISREYFVLGILVILLFLLNAFDKDDPQLHWYQFVFLLNYFFASLFINYYLLPRFFYQKKYLYFSLFLIMTIGAVVLVEEFVLEQIFFPNSRAQYFILIRTLFDVLPAILIFVGFKFAWDAVQSQKKVETLNRMVAESELKHLNSQINPHFLFNNLNNLYSYALECSPKTPEIILGLSSILRYMLYDCKEKMVPLKKEIENLSNLIDINKIQMESRGDVDFQYSNISEDLKIAPLILIVFVENAFKHAMASQSEDIKIKITLYVKDDIVHFYSENSYTKESNTNNLTKGIGLKNVISRLELVYDEKYTLNIEPNGNKYCVSLKIDLKS